MGGSGTNTRPTTVRSFSVVQRRMATVRGFLYEKNVSRNSANEPRCSTRTDAPQYAIIPITITSRFEYCPGPFHISFTREIGAIDSRVVIIVISYKSLRAELRAGRGRVVRDQLIYFTAARQSAGPNIRLQTLTFYRPPVIQLGGFFVSLSLCVCLGHDRTGNFINVGPTCSGQHANKTNVGLETRGG